MSSRRQPRKTKSERKASEDERTRDRLRRVCEGEEHDRNLMMKLRNLVVSSLDDRQQRALPCDMQGSGITLEYIAQNYFSQVNFQHCAH
jgi:hypothetical protein